MKKYISLTEAEIAVQNVLMDLGFEPLGEIANQFYEALERVKDCVRTTDINAIGYNTFKSK